MKLRQLSKAVNILLGAVVHPVMHFMTTRKIDLRQTLPSITYSMLTKETLEPDVKYATGVVLMSLFFIYLFIYLFTYLFI